MKEKEQSLEESSKEFLKCRIEVDTLNKGFNPVEIENLYEHIDKINYLLGREYLVEKEGCIGEETTVKSLRYILTSEGKEWALG